MLRSRWGSFTALIGAVALVYLCFWMFGLNEFLWRLFRGGERYYWYYGSFLLAFIMAELLARRLRSIFWGIVTGTAAGMLAVAAAGIGMSEGTARLTHKFMEAPGSFLVDLWYGALMTFTWLFGLLVRVVLRVGSFVKSRRKNSDADLRAIDEVRQN